MKKTASLRASQKSSHQQFTLNEQNFIRFVYAEKVQNERFRRF